MSMLFYKEMLFKVCYLSLGWSASSKARDGGYEEPQSSTCVSSLPCHRDIKQDLHGAWGMFCWTWFCCLTKMDYASYVYMHMSCHSVSTVLEENCLITSLLKTGYQRKRPECFSVRSSLRWPMFIARAMPTETSNPWVGWWELDFCVYWVEHCLNWLTFMSSQTHKTLFCGTQKRNRTLLIPLSHLITMNGDWCFHAFFMQKHHLGHRSIFILQ